MSLLKNQVFITGMGVITPISVGIVEFYEALKKGATNFSTISFEEGKSNFEYPIAQLDKFDFKKEVTKLGLSQKIGNKVKRLRNISISTEYGLYCALEAWKNAAFDSDIDLEKVAIVSSGSNVQQSHLQSTRNKYADKLQFLNPSYGFNFFDTDLVGTLSELLEIKGEGCSIGGASASGNMAIIQGNRLIASGEYDVVIVVAPLMDISVFEYQGLTGLGAMTVVNSETKASEMYRPFDSNHNGFVYGKCAGSVILESEKSLKKRNKKPYGSIEGFGANMDANRNPNPSVLGEQKAMEMAIKKAEILPNQIDYVNTHGTGSKIGDKTEVEALLALGLKNVKANSTKSLIGHGLSAAGVVETIASFIQMKEDFIHKSNNLISPINKEIEWITETRENVTMDYVISNSFGFGGINTSIVLKNNK